MGSMEYFTFKECGNRKVNVPKGTPGSSQSPLELAFANCTTITTFPVLYSSENEFNLSPYEVASLDSWKFLEWCESSSVTQLEIFSEYSFS